LLPVDAGFSQAGETTYAFGASLSHRGQYFLPSQKQLAREFALSESTLKRHFKAVYGKTMHDYYLEKKMELAKWLLQERKISVSETA
jgi:AraC-like DNA-binding protein